MPALSALEAKVLSMPKTASPSGLLAVSSNWLTIAPASPWASTVTSPPHAAPVDPEVVNAVDPLSGLLDAGALAPDEPQAVSSSAVAAASAVSATMGLLVFGMASVPLPLRRSQHGFRSERTFLRRHDPDQVRRSRTSCPALSPAHRTPVSRWSLYAVHPAGQRPRAG